MSSMVNSLDSVGMLAMRSYLRVGEPVGRKAGSGRPGTRVANILCTSTGALSPKAWYHSRKYLQ